MNKIWKEIRLIQDYDLDELVQSVYGRPYRFQQQDGCKERGMEGFTVPDYYDSDFENDTIPEEVNGEEMGVSFKAWLERDPKEWNGDPKSIDYVELFWERNFYPHPQMVLNDLYEKGYLEAGEYTINIDW